MKHYKPLKRMKLRNADLVPQRRWTPLMEAIRDYASGLGWRLMKTRLETKFVADSSEWATGLGDMVLESEGDRLTLIVGADTLSDTPEEGRVRQLDFTLLLSFSHMVAEAAKTDERDALIYLATSLKQFAREDPDWFDSLEARLEQAA